jgi:hypothetical protein
VAAHRLSEDAAAENSNRGEDLLRIWVFETVNHAWSIPSAMAAVSYRYTSPRRGEISCAISQILPAVSVKLAVRTPIPGSSGR